MSVQCWEVPYRGEANFHLATYMEDRSVYDFLLLKDFLSIWDFSTCDSRSMPRAGPIWQNNGSSPSAFGFKPMVLTSCREMGDMDRGRLRH